MKTAPNKIFLCALIVISPSDFLPIERLGSTEEAKADDKENTEKKYSVTAEFSTGVLLLLRKEQSATVLQNDLIAVTEVMFFIRLFFY